MFFCGSRDRDGDDLDLRHRSGPRDLGSMCIGFAEATAAETQRGVRKLPINTHGRRSVEVLRFFSARVSVREMASRHVTSALVLRVQN